MTKRILVAEDDSAMRTLLGESLEAAGFEVTLLDNGNQLLEWVKSSAQPDAVVADVRMPGHSGLAVLKTWRVYNKSTPFVLITSFPSERLRVDALRINAVLIEKPFEMQALLAELQRVCVQG